MLDTKRAEENSCIFMESHNKGKHDMSYGYVVPYLAIAVLHMCLLTLGYGKGSDD